MTTGFLQKIFGSRNQRLIKQYQKTVVAINALEPKIEQYTDEQLRAKTVEFRERVAKGTSLDELLPEAFAVCREASCITARSPKCAPAKARRSSRRSPPT